MMEMESSRPKMPKTEEEKNCLDDSIRPFNWGEKEFWEVLKGLLRGGEGDLRWCQEVKRGLAGV